MFPSNPLETCPVVMMVSFCMEGNRFWQGLIPPMLIFGITRAPSIYYINALGLYVGRGSRWGVWGVEYSLLFLAALLLFKISKDQWGEVSAFASMCFFIYIIYQIGPYGRHELNFTETYSVFF